MLSVSVSGKARSSSYLGERGVDRRELERDLPTPIYPPPLQPTTATGYTRQHWRQCGFRLLLCSALPLPRNLTQEVGMEPCFRRYH